MIRALSPVVPVLLLPRPSAASDELETYGDIAQIAIPGFAAVVSLAKKDTPGLIQLGVGTGLSAGIVLGLKYSIDSRRPDGAAAHSPLAIRPAPSPALPISTTVTDGNGV